MPACQLCLLTSFLPAVLAASSSPGLILLQTGAHPKSANQEHPHVNHRKQHAHRLPRDGSAQAPVVPAAPSAVSPTALPVPTAPAAVINNLGGVGPDYGMPPVMTLGSVFKSDGTMVDVIVTNASIYECEDATQNELVVGESGWQSSVINVRSDSALELNVSFVDHLTGAPTTLEKFVISILDLDESTSTGLRETLVARPDSFAVTSTTTLLISRTSTGDFVFGGTGGASGALPNPNDLTPEAQNAAVLLQYLNRQSFTIALQVIQTNPLIGTIIKTSRLGGRNFWLTGPSQLELTGVMINTTQLNVSGQIADGSGLGAGMAPAPVVAQVPNTSSSGAVGVAAAPTGLPSMPSQAQPNLTVANGTISTTPLIMPAPMFAPEASGPISVRGPTGIPVAVASVYTPAAEPAVTADAFVTAAPNLVPGATTQPPPTKGTPSFICASDNEEQAEFCPECTMSQMCQCNGWVKFGYEPAWTPWQQVNGVIECNATEFGDVYPGHGKICVCAQPMASQGYWTGPTVADMWWPILLVVVPATLLIAATIVAELIGSTIAGKSFIEVALEASAPSVAFAPMIAALFVAAAKRGEYVLAGGAGAESLLQSTAHGSPDLSSFQSVDVCIKVCAVAFVCQVVSRVIYEFLAARERARGPAISVVHNSPERLVLLCHHASVMVTYVSLAALLALLMTMGDLPFVEATLCTIILAVVYFGCYLVLHIMTFSEASEWGRAIAKLSVLNMQFAPMLSVLFIGMQVAAEAATGGPVKPYVEDWMKICTAATLLQVLLSVLMSALFHARLEIAPDSKEDLVVRRSEGVLLFACIRWATMAVLYLGVWKVSRAVWLTDMVQGRAHVLCAFAAVYFLAFAVLWVVMTLRQISEPDSWHHFAHAIRHCMTATQIVAVCPMAAAFFVGWWVVAAP